MFLQTSLKGVLSFCGSAPSCPTSSNIAFRSSGWRLLLAVSTELQFSALTSRTQTRARTRRLRLAVSDGGGGSCWLQISVRSPFKRSRQSGRAAEFHIGVSVIVRSLDGSPARSAEPGCHADEWKRACTWLREGCCRASGGGGVWVRGTLPADVVQ